MSGDTERTVGRLRDVAGRTYAEEAGIRLTDSPASLYRLLVLSVLMSARIKADIAVAAARELYGAGFGTAHRMRESSWQDRVDALGRGHYVRYDESTASTLGEGAALVDDEYGGDLRRMARRADGDPGRLRRLLCEVPGIGAVGADIFCREAQGGGRGCVRTSTRRPGRGPSGSGCPRTRRPWPGWSPTRIWPGSPRPWCGCGSTARSRTR